jgi:hypothetical protein
MGLRRRAGSGSPQGTAPIAVLLGGDLAAQVPLAEDVAGMVRRRVARDALREVINRTTAATTANPTTSIRPPKKMGESSNIAASFMRQVGS